MARIAIDGSVVRIDGVVVDDQMLARLLEAADQPEETLRRALEVGARGLLTMGLGIDLAEVDRRVRQSVEDVTTEARVQVDQVLTAARQAFSEHFDPERRSSMVARALDEFGAWRDGFLRGFNPDYSDSYTARFVDQITALLGPEGMLEARLREALDPDSDGSGLSRLSAAMEGRFREIRDLLMTERGRHEEATRGTRKGFVFEDVIEETLREAARGTGWIIERTARAKGDLSPEAMVGDFVATLPHGRRIVIEAKNTARINLTGKDGILEELDRAIANRSAEAAICVSARDVFPREVGLFGVYGDRVLVVDDGDGMMLQVALRWVSLMLEQDARGLRASIDQSFIEDRLNRIRQLAQTFSSNRRSLTDIKASVDNVQGSLEQLRSELLFLIDEITGELERTDALRAGASLVALPSEAG